MPFFSVSFDNSKLNWINETLNKDDFGMRLAFSLQYLFVNK